MGQELAISGIESGAKKTGGENPQLGQGSPRAEMLIENEGISKRDQGKDVRKEVNRNPFAQDESGGKGASKKRSPPRRDL